MQQVVDLYAEHAAGLCRYAVALVKDSHKAEDLVQEVFLRFLAERSLGHPVHNPKAWMYRVLRNLALDRLREVRRSAEVGFGQLPDEFEPAASPDESIERRQTADSVASALSGRELECARLRNEGLRYEEIAAVLGIRVGTVGTLLSRAYKKTREVLDDSRSVPHGGPFPRRSIAKASGPA